MALDHLQRPQSIFALQKALLHHGEPLSSKKTGFIERFKAYLPKPTV